MRVTPWIKHIEDLGTNGLLDLKKKEAPIQEDSYDLQLH